MRKILILLISIVCINITACNIYTHEITILYFVEDYKIHEAGVEIWAESETGEDIGIFIEHENIYCCDEDVSRVVCLYNKYSDDPKIYLKNQYLYFNKEDYLEYLKEIYDLE